MGNFKHIVITGASSGIGEALALAYAQEGVVLSLTGRNEERLKSVAASCRACGAEICDTVLDVADAEKMQAWLLERDQAQPVDLIVANAGISAGTGGGLETLYQLQQLFGVNVSGVFNTIMPLLPTMIERGSGHVAIMSSLAGFRGFPGAPGYGASKAAVKVYGEGLRGMLAGSGVDVSVICPGFVKSRMTDENDCPMPFFMETDRAVRIIQKGLAQKRGRIAFPLPMHFLVWLLGVIPDVLAHHILKGTPAKKSLD